MKFKTKLDVVKYIQLMNSDSSDTIHMDRISINDDLTIDILGSVQLYADNIPEHLVINKVHGDLFFIPMLDKLTLYRCPKIVEKSFFCERTQLRSLEHFPQHVGLSINLQGNHLTELKYIQDHVKGNLIVNNNKLTSIKDMPQRIDGNFNIINNTPLKDISPILTRKLNIFQCSGKLCGSSTYQLYRKLKSMEPSEDEF